MTTQNHQCSNFNDRITTVEESYHATELGLDPVYLVGIVVSQCVDCSAEEASIPRINNLMHTLAKFLITSPMVMLGSEIKFARKVAEIHPATLSAAIKIKAATLKKIEIHGTTCALEILIREKIAKVLGCVEETKDVCAMEWQERSANRSMFLQYNADSNQWQVLK